MPATSSKLTLARPNVRKAKAFVVVNQVLETQVSVMVSIYVTPDRSVQVWQAGRLAGWQAGRPKYKGCAWLIYPLADEHDPRGYARVVDLLQIRLHEELPDAAALDVGGDGQRVYGHGGAALLVADAAGGGPGAGGPPVAGDLDVAVDDEVRR